MERPDVRFARAADGAYLAYQVLGDGPRVIFWQEDSFALVDELWDSPPELAWHEGLASFARVIIYDRRGTGLSSRNVDPGSLEVQVQDTLAVLDAEGIERAAFGGFLESGATNVLLAATQPERVQAVVWVHPVPRTLQEPGYPWGVEGAYVEAERELLHRWGTDGWARDFVALNADVMRGPFASESYIRFIARASRRTCTPDVAAELARIWQETDVRDVLPAVQVPLLLVDFDDEHCRGLLRYLADLAPGTETHFIPEALEVEDFAPMHDAFRRFLGVERPAVGLDSVLATLMFTDVVGSTELAARMGDARWKELIAAHDARARVELERFHGVFVDSAGDGLLARFDGPARAVRCARAIAEAVRPLGLEVRAGCHTGEV
jgi:pimeloyl-ACP methyl ester carboxylesterase